MSGIVVLGPDTKRDEILEAEALEVMGVLLKRQVPGELGVLDIGFSGELGSGLVLTISIDRFIRYVDSAGRVELVMKLTRTDRSNPVVVVIGGWEMNSCGAFLVNPAAWLKEKLGERIENTEEAKVDELERHKAEMERLAKDGAVYWQAAHLFESDL